MRPRPALHPSGGCLRAVFVSILAPNLDCLFSVGQSTRTNQIWLVKEAKLPIFGIVLEED